MIHYEEDSFLLKEMLKTLRRGCSINIDSSIFLEYTISQLLFVGKALKELSSSITDSVHLKSPEHIRELLRVTDAFLGLLDDLLNDRLSFSAFCRNYEENFKRLSSEHTKSAAALRELLDSINVVNEQEQLVSEEEFMFLFKEDEETEN